MASMATINKSLHPATSRELAKRKERKSPEKELEKGEKKTTGKNLGQYHPRIGRRVVSWKTRYMAMATN